MDRPISLRRFVHLGVYGAAALLCGRSTPAYGVGANDGVRLQARPTKPRQRTQPGRHSFGLAKNRDGYLSVPPGYNPEKPVPFILMLHGARGSEGLDVFCDYAARDGIAVAVPDSRGPNWDRIKGTFGPDIEFLDRALEQTFDRIAVDRRRIALAGFSDGGSYSLSVGLSNGDLFTHVIAYSPGFMSVPVQSGKPRIFITHGAQDQVLPINPTKRIVSELERSGYAVIFKEFPGDHVMRPDLVKESFRWFAGTGR